MALLDQILLLPYAYLWVPGLVFVLVGGGLCWFIRPAPPAAEALHAQSVVVPPPAAPMPAKPKDQRTMNRRQGNPVEVFVAPPESKATPGTGSVLDRSMGGMRLALFNEVEIGTLLSIRPVHADDMVPWVDLEVRSCKVSTEMPGQFEVGCQYVKSPPYSIQLLFG
jgi:hypothetical protein